MDRADLIQLLRDIPVAIVILVALWAFCGLAFAVLA